MASHTREGVHGMSMCLTPSASQIALTIAGGEPTVADSPIPLAPIGWCGDGVTVKPVSQSGTSTAVEVPDWETDFTVTPSPHHPLGAKGIGESATVGSPPAIVNAICDALAPLGVRHVDMPCTPSRVWEAMMREGRPAG